MKKRILFISHEASRTGAPIVLLHFIRWLKRNTDVPFAVLIRECDGSTSELVGDFESVAPVLVLNGDRSSFNGLLRRAMRVARRTFTNSGSIYDDVRRWAKQNDISLIYSNTVTNGSLLEPLAAAGYPVITHVHELEFFFQHIDGAASVKRTLRNTQRFVAASNAVRDNLVENHGISGDKIDVIYEFIPTSNPYCNGNRGEQKEISREKLNIPQNAIVVAGSGTIDWRKGTDIFIQVAHLVHDRQGETPIYFLWIGGDKSTRRYAEIWHDVECVGLDDYVRFTGTVANPAEYLSLADIFILPSREDAFPLVCLEAASLGRPIICFESAGGAKEFVEEDAGFVVPYLGVEAMAGMVLRLAEDERLRNRLGNQALEKVRQRHDVVEAAPRLLRIIESFL